MRLIDADELVEALDEALEKRTDPMDALRKQLLVGFAKQILSDVPTAKAIPIEWIENYLEEHWRTTKLYATDYVDKMLNEWEEENETR